MKKYLFVEDAAEEEQDLKYICLYIGRVDEVLKLKQKLISDGYTEDPLSCEIEASICVVPKMYGVRVYQEVDTMMFSVESSNIVIDYLAKGLLKL